MSKVSALIPEFIDSFPTQLDPGVLYVSGRYSTAAHLCCCGCRGEVITPLSPAQWVLTFDGTVSLWPSVGNWALPCRSHYVIDGGRVRWARVFSDREIKLNRERDRRKLHEARARTPGWLQRAMHRIKPPPERSWRADLGIGTARATLTDQVGLSMNFSWQ